MPDSYMKIRIGRILTATFGLCVMLAGPVSAAATPGSTLKIAYTISFWGIPFGHTDFDTTFQDRVYQTRSSFETSGLVSVFWRSKIDAASNGYYTANKITPHVYDSYARRSAEKKQRVKLTFENGTPVLLATPKYSTTKYPVTEKQKREGLDPMSAIAAVITGVTVDAKNPCGTVAPVFDGRRRYNVEFTYIRDVPQKLDNGLYAGTAHLCQIHYRQIAGFKQKILDEGKKIPPIYGLFAEVPAQNAPNGHYIVALRVWTKTDWGTVSADLNALKVNGVMG
ncbi:MAG TPA: DUF3108 domain-containing protein [Rhizomicrobium sp.]|nr:DUF3108 domain-containing protein [Rhizomicrobium sp.]